MTRSAWIFGSLTLSLALSVGCADDSRPVVGIEPVAGESNGGGATGEGDAQAGQGGANQADSSSGGASASGEPGAGGAVDAAAGAQFGGAASGGARM